MTQNESGKRYLCPVCGSEVIVTKSGKGQKAPLVCHGQPMALKKGAASERAPGGLAGPGFLNQPGPRP